jgi:hypothetical protein
MGHMGLIGQIGHIGHIGRMGHMTYGNAADASPSPSRLPLGRFRHRSINQKSRQMLSPLV